MQPGPSNLSPLHPTLVIIYQALAILRVGKATGIDIEYSFTIDPDYFDAREPFMPSQNEPHKYRDLLLHSDDDYEPYGLSYSSSRIEMGPATQDIAMSTVYGEYLYRAGDD